MQSEESTTRLRSSRVKLVECGALLRKAYLNPQGQVVRQRFCDRSVLLQPNFDQRYLVGTCLRCGFQRVDRA